MAEQAVKDAYAGLKTLIKSRYPHVSVETLENDPADEMRQQVLQADLKKAAADTDDEIVRHAKALLDAINKDVPKVAGSKRPG